MNSLSSIFAVASLFADSELFPFDIFDSSASRSDLSLLSKSCGMKRRLYKKLWKSGRLPPHCSRPSNPLDAVVSAASSVFSTCFGMSAIRRSFSIGSGGQE